MVDVDVRVLVAGVLLAGGCAVGSAPGAGEGWDPPEELVTARLEGELAFGVDIHHWTGAITDAEVACMRAEGVRHVIAGTQVERITRQQLEMAVDGGMTVGAYVYLYWTTSVAEQVERARSRITGFPVDILWLDVEEREDVRSPREMARLLREGLDACGDTRCGIYTGNPFWREVLADDPSFADVPVWYAWYDGDPSLDTWERQSFGGWEEPYGKQWSDEGICGLIADLDTIHVEVAPTRPPPEPGVDAPGPPPAPTGLYPDGHVVRRDGVRVLCSAIPGATRYEIAIEFHGAGGFRPYATYSEAVGARLFFPTLADRVYRFRVRARDADGWGPWSRWASFDYGSPTSRPAPAPEDPAPAPAPEDPAPAPAPEDPDPAPDPEDPDPEDPAPAPAPAPAPEDPDPAPDPDPDPAADPCTVSCPAFDGTFVCEGERGFRTCPIRPDAVQACTCTATGWRGCASGCLL